jgi:hydroxymethylpyrimidine/phosphomethylpyrimidine kinase
LKRSAATAPNLERAIPVALTIAGSDSSAGAGAQADLKTFSALGVYGLTAITCVVAETPGKVTSIQDIGADIVREQIEVLLDGFPIAAIKTGMLYSGDIISVVARALADHAKKIPLVVDPVMVATSGDALLQSGAIACYENELFPRASLITPNLDEAAQLLGITIKTITRMRTAGKKLAEKYRAPILLKGGHLAGNQAIDLLFVGGKVVEFSAPFVRNVSTHGTGCTYSAAITAGLALGWSLEESIRQGKHFVTATIAQHFSWSQKPRAVVHALNHSPRENL